MKRRRFLSLAGLVISLLVPSQVLGDGAEARQLAPEGGLLLPPRAPAAASNKNTIYLTFDDGYVGLNEKIGALNALGVQAIFFLTGGAIRGHPRDVQWLIDSGHLLGNHTYSHQNLTRVGSPAIAHDLQACEQAAQDIAGVSTLPYMRPPYGAVNQTVRRAAADLGYDTVLWNWDTRDWAGASAVSIARNVGPGIVLMHTQGRNTVSALDNVVPALQEQGYVFAVL